MLRDQIATDLPECPAQTMETIIAGNRTRLLVKKASLCR